MSESTLQEFDHPIKDHLVCYQQISLRWRKLEQPLADGQLFRLQNENTKLMEVLVSSDDVGDLEPPAEKESVNEIKRLDAKLNLLMGWIGQMLLQQQALPDPQTICLSPAGLQFSSNEDKVLGENDNLYIEMFLEPRYPQAFVTVAKVVQVISREEGDEVLVRFQNLNELNQHWLDKYVFQLHRRQVALARKQNNN